MFTEQVRDEVMCKTNSGNKIYWLITSENGAPNFEMRYIEIPPGGKSSFASHKHEHEVFILSGSGKIVGPGGETPLPVGTAVFVPGSEVHQWVNTGDKPFGFICVVPKGAEAESKPPCWS